MNTISRTGWTLLSVVGAVCLLSCAGNNPKSEIGTNPPAGGLAVMPITTTSHEAKELLFDARDEYLNVRMAESYTLADKALNHDEDFAMAYLYRGMSAQRVEEQTADILKAVELSRKASKGERLFIQAVAANLLENDGERAIALMKKAAKKYPGDKWIHNSLGVYHYVIGDFADALQHFNTALELDPQYAATHNMLGYTAWKMGDFSRAEAAFMAYVSLAPKHPNSFDSIGEFYMKMGRFEEAIVNFQQAVNLDKSFLGSMRKIGICEAYLGHYDEATATFAKADDFSSSPIDKAANRTSQGRAHLIAGDFVSAAKSYDEAVAITLEADLPQRAALYQFQKGWICFEAGMINDSEVCLALARQALGDERILAGVRDNYHQYGILLESSIIGRRGDYDGALEIAEEINNEVAAGRNPDGLTRYYYQALATIYLAQGMDGVACTYLQQADQQDPRNIYLLAKSEDGRGNNQRAHDLYRMAADWNEDTFSYALIRSKALAALQ